MAFSIRHRIFVAHKMQTSGNHLWQDNLSARHLPCLSYPVLWSRGSGYLNIPTCTSVESIDIGSRKQSKPSSHTRECGVIGIGRGIVPCISDHPFIVYLFSLGARGGGGEANPFNLFSSSK